MPDAFTNSSIYLGTISHRRFSPKKHSFNYQLFMLALDVAYVERANTSKGIFGFSWFHPLRFVESDYVNNLENIDAKNEPNSLSHRIINKVRSLDGHNGIEKIIMLVQVRCFGIYFSPANFYFCYDQDNNCTQMLAEVSNTPWNERHYYLVDLLTKESDITTEKTFQVSPFMDLAMTYYWYVKPPTTNSDKLVVKIENKKLNKQADKASKSQNVESDKIFDASLIMHKQPFTNKHLFRIWCQLPVMTIKVVVAIYWQALRLFIKRVPFLGYQKKS